MPLSAGRSASPQRSNPIRPLSQSRQAPATRNRLWPAPVPRWATRCRTCRRRTQRKLPLWRSLPVGPAPPAAVRLPSSHVLPPSRASPHRDLTEHDTPASFEYHPPRIGACRPATIQAILSMQVVEGEKRTVKQNLRSRKPEVEDVRSRIRSGEHDGPTAGLVRGHVQTNLVILPGDYAFDFLKFCVRNPKPCPILEVTDAGSPEPPVMAPGADLRTDVPKYRVLPGRATRRRAHGHRGVLAQRSGVVLDRVQLHVREGAARRRVAPGARRSGKERTDVRDGPRVRTIRSFRRADGRQHAALPARGDPPGCRDLGPVPDARG